MPRSTLSIVLALILFVGFATTAKADVTGSFDIHITLTPEGTQTEAVKYFIDFQSNLQINITLSGLTFSADIGFGTTGVEFAVLGLNTNLGALAISDSFVFAAPFGCTLFPDGVSNTFEAFDPVATDWNNLDQCPGLYVVKLDTDNHDHYGVGFVKKRIEMELNIAGITLTNLALFEDVDFPDIQGLKGALLGTGLEFDHEPDHFNPTTATNANYYVTQVDNTVDNQTPTFGFGDVITLSGQTVSGITVTGSTAICAGDYNYIKKRSWPYQVNKACTAALGGRISPIEPDDEGVGQKTPLLFEEETLSIEGIELGGVTVDVYTEWHPNDPNGFSTLVDVSFSVLDLADVFVEFSSNNITSLSMDYMIVSISTGNLSMTLYDFDADLTFDRTVAVLSLVLNPNQNPADLTILVRVQGGITRAEFSLGISRGLLSLDTTTRFSGSAGTLAWAFTTFSLSVDSGNGFNFGADFRYTPTGMGQSSVSLGITF